VTGPGEVTDRVLRSIQRLGPGIARVCGGGDDNGVVWVLNFQFCDHGLGGIDLSDTHAVQPDTG